MLALCLALVINFAGLNAQTNSEYTFRQQSVADGVAFGNNGDPVPILTMPCLSANGYGQWTLSSAAIHLINTTANVRGNTITDRAWPIGIIIDGVKVPGASVPPTTQSLVCSNTIEDLHPPDKGSTHSTLEGIRSEYHIGIARHNNVSDCEVAYSANGHGWSSLVFNTIDETFDPATTGYDVGGIHTGSAIEITGTAATNKVDLSGIHSTVPGGDDVTANNDIKGSIEDGGVPPLISIGNNSEIVLGNSHAAWAWSNYAQNNVYVLDGPLPSGVQPAFDDAYILEGVGSSPASLGDIDYNFWGLDATSTQVDPINGSGADPHHWNQDLPSQLNALSITYDHVHTVNTLASPILLSGVGCDGFAVSTKRHGSRGTSSKQDTIPHDCNFSYNLGTGFIYRTPRHPDLGYDTLKSFVERCPTNPNAPSAFGDMSGAVQQGGHGPSPECWTDFKKWLLSAFAWNPNDPTYFCADVETLVGALAETNDTSWAQENTATNKQLSIVWWLIHNPMCSNSSDSEEYTNSRGTQRAIWQESVDTSKVKFDTTLYSMHDLGLDSVLKYAGLLGVQASPVEEVITSATAYPNPLVDGTVISFGIKREAYVSIEVFDLLGHRTQSGHFEGVEQAGNFSVPISLAGLPSGTYYARLQTTYGETRSVKLIKE